MQDHHTHVDPSAEVVAEQARKVRSLYPELFAALDDRDRRIKQALQRIPHPADPEALVPPQMVEQALQSLRQLDSGIGEFFDHDTR